MKEIIINNETYILMKKTDYQRDYVSDVMNSGDYNSGYKNSGDYNSGDNNSGDRNSGYYNSGDFNSGTCNSGDNNSGDNNSGDYNSGDYNSGDFNSGILNTTKPNLRIFNKECRLKLTDLDLPIFFEFALHTWVEETYMTEQEKIDNPSYKDTKGYLKELDYKEAWRKSWNKANLNDKTKVLNLPNFNNEIFKEISGIDVALELNLIK